MNSVTSSGAVSPRLDQIIDAARTLFVQYGYRRTAMEDIAREAGLAKATLYLHFSGKEQVFRAMVERCRAVIAERCDEAERLDAPFAERLASLLDAHFGTALEWFGEAKHIGELRAFLRQEGDPMARQGEEDFRARLLNFLSTSVKRGEIDLSRTGLDLEAVAEVLFQAAAGAKHQCSDGYRAAALNIARLMLAGLSPSR